MNNKIFAGFNFSTTEQVLIGILLVLWFIFVLFLFIFALYVFLYVLSKVTKKDLSFQRLFLNKSIKSLYPKFVIVLLILVMVLWVYYGVFDN
jgi:uncharacterized membrane protein